MTDLNLFHGNVKAGNLDAVRAALVDAPALLNAKNEAGQSAVLLSKYYGQARVTEHLLSLNPSLDIFTAAAVGLQELVLQELDRDPVLIAAHSADGWTALHLAAFFGHKPLAMAVIARGADVNARATNAMKNTPLHAAAAGRKADLVELLLHEGADANATQEGGWTALHAAAQNGDRGIVALLIANGADSKMRADNHQCALDLALMKGHQEIVDLLVEPSEEDQ
jgi:ankyrin repeat protein